MYWGAIAFTPEASQFNPASLFSNRAQQICPKVFEACVRPEPILRLESLVEVLGFPLFPGPGTRAASTAPLYQ